MPSVRVETVLRDTSRGWLRGDSPSTIRAGGLRVLWTGLWLEDREPTSHDFNRDVLCLRIYRRAADLGEALAPAFEDDGSLTGHHQLLTTWIHSKLSRDRTIRLKLDRETVDTGGPLILLWSLQRLADLKDPKSEWPAMETWISVSAN